MPEHRGRKHHQDRVAETLREEIGVLIEGELVDPRINLCYVTEVALNPGGKSARVYVAVDSAIKDIEKAEEETVAGLEAAGVVCLPLAVAGEPTIAMVRQGNEYARAERLYLLALEIDEHAYGPRHAATQGDLRLLASFLRERGRAREAAEVEKRLAPPAPRAPK